MLNKDYATHVLAALTALRATAPIGTDTQTVDASISAMQAQLEAEDTTIETTLADHETRILALEGADNAIDEGLNPDGETDADLSDPNDGQPIATVITSDPATGSSAIVTTDSDGAVKTTPIVDGTVTPGTVTVADDGTPTVDHTLVDGATPVTLGDTTDAHVDVVNPAAVVAADPSANVAAAATDDQSAS